MMVSLPVIPKPLEKQDLPTYINNNPTNKPYNYFETRISKSHIKSIYKNIKDDRFRFFIKIGCLRRYEGNCELIYVEVPQIPKQLVIYRRPCIRIKSPEKLILKNKDLPHIPLFEGEENLNALSLECNLITKIDKLISLNSLTYLNLYFNYIKDIENLQSLSHLRVLLLGKNLIEKIKNLTALTELEILDIHSNRIKQLENLNHLRKLKILNIANNQITSLNELVMNKALEDLNVRKNLVSELPDLTRQWDKMTKINLGKNFIARLQWVGELKKLKHLIDVSLEDNPVCAMNKECSTMLKGIMKVNITMSTEANNKMKMIMMMNNTSLGGGIRAGLGMSMEIGKNMLDISSQKTNDRSRCASPLNSNSSHGQLQFQLQQLQSILSNNKAHYVSNILTPGLTRNSINSSSPLSSEPQTPTIITAYRSKWSWEYDQIIKGGYNGYNLKRNKEILINNGHIEYDLTTEASTLLCYGDCIKNLFQGNTYHHVTSIQFNYFHYDSIMRKKNIEKLKEFKQLTGITFKNNNVHCFYQLIKLEELAQLESVNISENEVCTAGLLKYFLRYRKQNIKMFNEEEISQSDADVSKNVFELFDKCISIMDMKEKEEEETMRIKKERNERNEGKEENIEEDEDDEDEDDEEYDWETRRRRSDIEKYNLYSYVRSNLDIAIQEIMSEYAQSLE